MLNMNRERRYLYWHKHSVTVKDRWEMYGYRGCVIWFTGLSAAGKSTIANALCKELHKIKVKSYVLDGDNIRHGLNNDLGFNLQDRKENIRRIGEVAKLFVDAGLIVMTAFISPFKEDSNNVRMLLKQGEFIEVFVKCPIQECVRRDPKGIYLKAIAGEIEEFTGISSPYEEPENPEIVLEADRTAIEECVERLFAYLIGKNYIYYLTDHVKR